MAKKKITYYQILFLDFFNINKSQSLTRFKTNLKMIGKEEETNEQKKKKISRSFPPVKHVSWLG